MRNSGSDAWWFNWSTPVIWTDGWDPWRTEEQNVKNEKDQQKTSQMDAPTLQRSRRKWWLQHLRRQRGWGWWGWWQLQRCWGGGGGRRRSWAVWRRWQRWRYCRSRGRPEEEETSSPQQEREEQKEEGVVVGDSWSAAELQPGLAVDKRRRVEAWVVTEDPLGLTLLVIALAVISGENPPGDILLHGYITIKPGSNLFLILHDSNPFRLDKIKPVILYERFKIISIKDRNRSTIYEYGRCSQ